MLRPIVATVADTYGGTQNMSRYYNAIESLQHLKDCYDYSDDILVFTTYMIFQGLRNVTYTYFNNTDYVGTPKVEKCVKGVSYTKLQ